ncbi:MAG TPA: hypothetical protein DEG42_07440 [Acholeplasmataceae bacterium]|nr:MAG: hypothetical protein A2Y43_01870 [Tenericutes bacterium GWA2_38_26]OHE32727.1 MAG: hypothetical protein A2009_04560 [Tenericutes bacterium GWD2_38_27]OHE37739.1 MAG: hypothetical protein A2013_03095 [Tenericutes bacterium GWE2_38_8]HBG33674.1 hypothetical protein [Acholeplasmataceae bacterium]HBY66183.1 hypothetical protein [Acholeplasmataceae bacterium]
MKTWLRELERELKRRFYDEEVKDVLSYYEEMIQERLSSGEQLDDILESYNIRDIAKSITPEVIMKRTNDTYKKAVKSTKQLVAVLLSTPLLIPLGVLYLSLLIFAVSMMIASGAVILSSIVGGIAFLADLSQSNLGTNEVMGLIGMLLMTFSLMILFSLWMFRWIQILTKKLLYIFSKLARNKGEKNESIN